MHLEWLALSGFRSYEELSWTPGAEINVLVGSNGAGKTNLLEAISYAATLKSFRGAPDEAMVAHGQDSAVVRTSVSAGDASSLIEVELRARGGRRAQVNRHRLPRAADLLGHVRIVAFLPEDLDIIKRGPAYRRDVIDDAAVQLWPASHIDQADFERALRQRNAFLKQYEDDPVTLAVWDERVAQAGARVMSRRARAVSAVQPHLSSAHREVSESDAVVDVAYTSAWNATLDSSVSVNHLAQLLLDALQSRHRLDRERRVTTVGPHRDEPVLLLDGHDSRHHASQGEQRTLALGLRVATHRAITDMTGASPILLLDDVYSELDARRGEALTQALPPAQTLVTTAHPGDVPLKGDVWSVGGGEVVRI